MHHPHPKTTLPHQKGYSLSAAAPRSLQDLLNERDRLTSEFGARVRAGASPGDAEVDRHNDEVRGLDRAILGRADADASPADLLLQAEHAIGFLNLPQDEAGETDQLDVLAARALKASLLRLAAGLGRR